MSQLGAKLGFRDASSHSSSGRNTAGDGLEQVVHIISSTPLLVGEDVTANVAFLTLDELDVSFHTLRGE